MLANQEVGVEVKGELPARFGQLQPISRLCVLRTRDCELTALWQPSACAWGLIETNKKKGV